MKSVKEFELSLADPKVFEQQFEEYSDANILWISPQLTGRQLYKTIFPSWFIESENVFTAIAGLEKHNPEAQFNEVHAELETKHILWADVVIFPFTKQPLVELYEQIRAVNPKIRIYFSVDFNFYLIGKDHPYFSIFNNEQVKIDIGENMYFADMVITSNLNLKDYLKEKILELSQGDFKEFGPTIVQICTIPFLTHKGVITGNMNFQPTPKVEKKDQFRIGIVATNVYFEDIMAFRETFIQINKKFKKKVELVFYGFDGKYKEKDALEDVKFEFHKPTSIIQYFKQLNSLNLDLLFIPLRATEYNQSSENYNKYMEAALLGIPILTNANVYPYSKIIENEKNGFLFRNKTEIVKIIADMIKKREKLNLVAQGAYQDVNDNFQFTPESVETLKNNLLGIAEEEKNKFQNKIDK